jgi:hypothetical protein
VDPKEAICVVELENNQKHRKMRLEQNSDINEYGLLDGLPRDDRQLKRQRYGAFTLMIVSFVLILVLFILYANVETHKDVKVTPIFYIFVISSSVELYSFNLH